MLTCSNPAARASRAAAGARPGRMHPVQRGQHVRGDRLHAQRHPRVAGGAQLREQLRRRRLRVGLGGHLGAAAPATKCSRTASSTPVRPVAAQQRRRSAADEHRAALGGEPSRRPPGQLGAQRRQPAVGVRAAQFGGRVGVEVAVSAAGGAERHMDVDAERPARRRRKAGQVAGAAFGPSYSQFPRRAFAHHERKSRPVRAYVDVRGTIGTRDRRPHFHHRVSLVARRHVDFKRVCTCCCLP